MRLFRSILLFFAAPLALFAGCAPKAKAPLPGSEFLRAMQQRAGQTETKTGANNPLSGPPQAAYINVGAIAARLPAWQLAANLEKADTSLRFGSIAAPGTPRALQLQSAIVEPPSGNLPRPASENDKPVVGAPAYQRPSQRVAARDAPPLENQAKERQEGTLESFLAEVQRRQNANRTDDRMQLRAELEDEIEASQRLALANLQPLLPPPSTQLEMTNLRIQLLPNSPASDDEKVQAKTRLAQLEADWRLQLQTQADERFEELRRLLTEVPLEKREAGLKEIEKTLNERGVRDENLRKTVTDALRNRISAGFNSDDMEPLFIQLPGAQLPPQMLNSTPTFLAGTPSYRFNNQINSNTSIFWPSVGAFAKSRSNASAVAARNATPLKNTQKRALALRQQALREAAQWAKTIARRRNWILQNPPRTAQTSGVPDRTGEALKLLNL